MCVKWLERKERKAMRIMMTITIAPTTLATRSRSLGVVVLLAAVLASPATPTCAFLGTTTRVSVDSAGNEGNARSSTVSISADGRFVAFSSDASNLVPGDTNRVEDVFVHDRKTGITTRVSVDNAGNQGNGFSSEASISADGRFVAFGAFASNLVPWGHQRS
jgi:WD40-like Beta Propeller Repeat